MATAHAHTCPTQHALHMNTHERACTHMQKTRVSVANLKNATQAKQRREKHCEAMVKQAVAKAKLEGVDDAKAIVMEFEGLRPM